MLIIIVNIRMIIVNQIISIPSTAKATRITTTDATPRTATPRTASRGPHRVEADGRVAVHGGGRQRRAQDGGEGEGRVVHQVQSPAHRESQDVCRAADELVVCLGEGGEGGGELGFCVAGEGGGSRRRGGG